MEGLAGYGGGIPKGSGCDQHGQESWGRVNRPDVPSLRSWALRDQWAVAKLLGSSPQHHWLSITSPGSVPGVLFSIPHALASPILLLKGPWKPSRGMRHPLPQLYWVSSPPMRTEAPKHEIHL